MMAIDVQNMQNASAEAVKKLRLEKLNNGHPFLIFDDTLPAGQCYLEFPDGIIRIVVVGEHSRKFATIKTLSSKESNSVRNQHHLAKYA